MPTMSELTNLQMTTPDGRAERLAALKHLFPDLFTLEGKLNPDELTKLADPDQIAETERYEFRWFGKTKAKREAYTPTDTTLTFDAARSLNADQTENLIVEGENLDALKLLACAYREKVKCIYIDPPYNTGNDFVYDDDFAEHYHDYLRNTGQREGGIALDTNSDSDGRFHSKWLDMMLPRLLLARTLLREDGVIFVSIDDHEVHHLRKLMDEVFGDENFISQFTVQSNPRGRQAERFVATVHEYIISYAKDASKCQLLGAELSDKQVKDYKFKDEQGASYRLLGLRQRGSASRREDRPKMFFPIYVDPNTRHVALERDSQFTEEVLPRKSTGEDGRWMWGPEKVGASLAFLEAKLIEDRDEWDVFVRDFLLSADGDERTTKVKTIWAEKETNYQIGTQEIKAILDSDVFSFPKPTSLLKRIVEIADDRDGIFLDFFAGSGTTAQAVMELNEADGGQRKFILVQLDEATDPKSEAHKTGYKKISDITIERAKRAAAKLHTARETTQPKLEEAATPKPTHGFKVFRLTPSQFPRTEWAPDPAQTDTENLTGLRDYIAAKENSLTLSLVFDDAMRELLLKKEGMSLHARWRRHAGFAENAVYVAEDAVNRKRVLVCLDDVIQMSTVDYFKTQRAEKFICLERALDTTAKWNLNHLLGDKFQAY